MKSIAFVTTTINVPIFLSDYVKLASKYPEGSVSFIIVGDNKTPESCEDFCHSLGHEYSVEVHYLSPERQRDMLLSFRSLGESIPWNCIQRRNVGLLLAYGLGCDIILTLDDDNFLTDELFFERFQILGDEGIYPTLRNQNSWVNVCSWLDEVEGKQFFHRGFPVELRKDEYNNQKSYNEGCLPMVLAGLWTGEPDIDAATRLSLAPTVKTYSGPDYFVLGKRMWSPFNSQNTGLLRSVLPAYFLSPSIGRYDDIWASYVALFAIQNISGTVAFGRPVAVQNRNEHNVFRDLDMELFGMRNTETLHDWLNGVPDTGKDTRGWAEVAIDFIEKALDDCTLVEGDLDKFKSFCQGYRTWFSAIDKMDSDGSQRWKDWLNG
ncbi:hypothetical protein [Desulfosediminicola sp.]|uniref:hypothetical protein n=1 Tax=Desulfosediminicola sp. TaxID=2886825 RepID=UPI003AF30AF8